MSEIIHFAFTIYRIILLHSSSTREISYEQYFFLVFPFKVSQYCLNIMICSQIAETSTSVPSTVAGCVVPKISDHVIVEAYCQGGESVEVGKTCRFSCDFGYKLEGNSSSLCQAVGYFSQDFPSCKKTVKNDDAKGTNMH